MSPHTRLAIFIVYIFLLRPRLLVKGDTIDVILPICDDGSCVRQDDPNIQDYRRSLYDFLTGGFGKIIWDGLSDDQSDLPTGVSTSCRTSLQNIIDGIKIGHRPSLELVTATGSRPDKFFQATLTTLGDYDACLRHDGRYCLVDVFPTRWSKDFRSRYPGHLFLDEVTTFRNLSLVTGVCLPSKCSAADIRSVLTSILPKHHLLVEGNFDCVTREDNSYINRVFKMTNGQLVSATFLGLIIGLVSLASLVHVYRIIVNHGQIKELEVLEDMIDFRPATRIDQFVDIFSVLKNSFRLASSGSSGHFFAIDVYKLSLVIFGCLGHSFLCVEIPNSYLMLDNHLFLHETFRSSRTQGILNDNGLVVFAHIGGFTTFMVVYPMISKMGHRSFPYLLTILDRYLHFIPSIMSVVALEFLWPMAFDGPFYKRVGDFVLSKCSKSWWWNLTFLQNWWPVLDICGGHTFFSAVDMQLFILGLVMMAVTASSKRNGIILGTIVSIAASMRVMYNSYKYQSTMTMYTPNPDTRQILSYLDHVHMTTSIYIPGYVIGLLNGLILYSGFRLPLRSVKDHFLYISVAFLLPPISFGICGLYNDFQIVPQFLVPPLIMVNRMIQSMTCFVFLTYFMSLEWKSPPTEPPTNGRRERGYSFLKAGCRLSYAIYLSNYLVVKTDFFTSRSLLSQSSAYAVILRVTSSLSVMVVVAVAFHLLFVAPFDGLRRLFFRAIRSKND